jgi:hypothetical protein
VLSHPSSMSGKTRINGMFFDQRISSRTMLARTLWQQGVSDQARDCAQEGLALARSIDHALSLCFVLAHAVVPIALWRGELPFAAEMTQLLLSRSQEHGFFIWHGYGRAYQASLQLETKWTLVESTRPAMGALLLETLATLDETLAADEVLARGESGRAGWCTPELLRISGRRLLRPGGTNRDKAEVLMLRSIDTARRQGALSWELRAAISLAQLWQTQDRNSQASDLLASTGIDPKSFQRRICNRRPRQSRRSPGGPACFSLKAIRRNQSPLQKIANAPILPSTRAHEFFAGK